MWPFSKIKHYGKPKHEILDKEDTELLSKNDLVEEDKEFRQEEGLLKKIFGKKKKDLEKAKKAKVKGSAE